VEYASDGSALRAIGAVADVTAVRRADEARRRQLSFVTLAGEVAATANQAVGVVEAFDTVLRLACRHVGWPVGHAMVLGRVGDETAPLNCWHADDPTRFTALRRVSDATVVVRGIGMLGRAWQEADLAWMTDEPAFARRAAATASGLHGGIAVPVLVGTTVVGVIEFFSETELAPADDLVAAMRTIGSQLGRVVERAAAEQHLRDYARRLATLSRRLLEAQETERRHVARELHDEIGQTLTVLKLNLQRLRAGVAADVAGGLLDESLAIADRTLQQTRDLSLDLRPALLDEVGLVPALRWYLDRQGRRAGFTTHFAADEVGEGIAADVAVTCFRIAQEALTNVARHACTTHAIMRITRRHDALELLIRDDGRGFDHEEVAATAARRGNLGLLGMRERAGLVGGQLLIDSAPGRGTAVHLVLPLSRTAALAARTARGGVA
jgi:signal transduction histidine kinase